MKALMKASLILLSAATTTATISNNQPSFNGIQYFDEATTTATISNNQPSLAFNGIQYFDEATNATNSPPHGVMSLQMLNNTATSGAVCLDGTPAGFYYSPAANPTASTSWQIYFQGGGWCYDEMDCYGRSSTNLGSYTNWAPTGKLGGVVSADCQINPDFCNFHRVWMVYCDGNSFSGNRYDPILVKDKLLYFRGRRIIDETLK